MTASTNTRPLPPRGLTRRTVVVTAAWAAPAVVLVSAVPAFASSATLRTTLTVPGTTVPATGSVMLTVTVTDLNGAPLAGRSVTLVAPAGSVLGAPAGVTSGAGVHTSTFDLDDPRAVPGSTITLTAIVDGEQSTATFTVTGANALAFGSGANGALGDGQTADRPSPVRLPPVFPSPIRQITSSAGTAGQCSLALLADGTVWAAGNNTFGQLGIPGQGARYEWKPVPGLTDVTQLSLGTNTCFALRSDGTVYAWGDNSVAALGDGTTVSRSVPAPVSGISTATSIAAGVSAAYAVLADGSVAAWGYAGAGLLGDGSTKDAYAAVPVSVVGVANAVAVSCGWGSGYALLSDGTVRSWAGIPRGSWATTRRPIAPAASECSV